jgi:hypothetical protein
VVAPLLYPHRYQLLRHPQRAVCLAQCDGSLAAQFLVETENLMLAAADEPANSPLQFAGANHCYTGEKSAVHGCSDKRNQSGWDEKQILSVVHLPASAGLILKIRSVALRRS